MLDKTFESNDYDEVIVENQPSLKNPTMKSIQMIVYTYFLIKSDVKVEMINAKNKLKVYKGTKILIRIYMKLKINIKIINF